MKQNYVKHKLSKQSDNYRKSRLIQLGGLIGLIDIFHIKPGEADINSRDKAAELLGEATHHNFDEPNDFNRWSKIGKRYLSQ